MKRRLVEEVHAGVFASFRQFPMGCSITPFRQSFIRELEKGTKHSLSKKKKEKAMYTMVFAQRTGIKQKRSPSRCTALSLEASIFHAFSWRARRPQNYVCFDSPVAIFPFI